MRLIGNGTSPFVRKVRVVMLEKKLEYSFVSDNVWAPDSRVGESNPLGKIPCLVMEGGEALFDSRVIVEYLDTLSPVGKLIPASGRERAEVKTWEALADGLLDAGLAVFLERSWAGRTAEQRSPAWIERQSGKMQAALNAMEQGLASGVEKNADKTYCCGIHLSLADIAVVCALGWLDLRFTDLGWRDNRPHLTKLYERLQSRSSFAETVPVMPPAAAPVTPTK